MRVYVYVLEARGLPRVRGADGGLVDAYVKLKVGKHKSRTKTIRRSQDPVWNEEFMFTVEDDGEDEAVAEAEKLSVRVFHRDDGSGGLFGGGAGELLGRVKIPLSRAFAGGRQTLPPMWFPLWPRHNRKSKARECGKLLLTISLYGRRNSSSGSLSFLAHSSLDNSASFEVMVRPTGAPQDIPSSENAIRKTTIANSTSNSEGSQSGQALAGQFVKRLLYKNEETFKYILKNRNSVESSDTPLDTEIITDGISPGCIFEEAIEMMQSIDKKESPENLKGGILLEKMYLIAPKDLNIFLFKPNSGFRRDVAELQGTTDFEEGSWMWKSEELSLRRLVTYTKAATKLVKTIKAKEEQTYLKADGKEFAILASVSTPDVPCGNYFQVELLYMITPGKELSSGDESSCLIISWNINFFQSTVMRGVIERATKQGLKENFEQFAELLAQNIEPVDCAELPLRKKQVLGPLQLEHHSDWELAIECFWKITVFSTILMGLYVLLHILLSRPSTIKGLEFNGLDLPDTFGEFITSGILILQGKRVINMISHFVQARLRRGRDNGFKDRGDGWLLTVALVEGNNIPSSASTGMSDPYVVFTCNGKTRTSSVQLQALDPQWNEIMEFNAMQEPPSMLDVEVFDFDGPFYLSKSLGHAEINFLKHTSANLADIWVPLEGRMAQAFQSRLHLRISLDNTKGAETIKEYLTRMEKEVGKKLNLRSPHRNSMFQKIFGLPPEEFLINDFSCSLKRRMSLQGRLFLSARILGFYSNLFGYKTKFFFLWEDIEDIQVISPSFATMGSPSLMIILQKGRGFDARQGAKSRDKEGRLRFQFQSFVSFNVISRTISALWKTRMLNSEEAQVKGLQDQHENCLLIEDTGSSLSTDEHDVSKIYSAELHVHISSLMKFFDGGHLEQKMMEKIGCLDYTTTPWAPVKPDVYERHTHYKFNHHVSIFGGEVTSTQLKTSISDGKGWTVDETMTFRDVPFGDHFQVHLRYKMDSLVSDQQMACHCNVYMGFTWLKGTRFQKRITRNIYENLAHRSKEIFDVAEWEIISAGQCHVEDVDA